MKTRTTSAVAGAHILLDRGTRDQLRLSWRLIRDKRVSALKYAIPALIALYVLSPIDSIPDFLFGFGQMDDLGVVVAGLLLFARIVPRLTPEHVLDEHLRAIGGTGYPSEPASGEPEGAIDARFSVRG